MFCLKVSFNPLPPTPPPPLPPLQRLTSVMLPPGQPMGAERDIRRRWGQHSTQRVKKNSPHQKLTTPGQKSTHRVKKVRTTKTQHTGSKNGKVFLKFLVTDKIIWEVKMRYKQEENEQLLQVGNFKCWIYWKSKLKIRQILQKLTQIMTVQNPSSLTPSPFELGAAQKVVFYFQT